jgi:hypothetical protein
VASAQCPTLNKSKIRNPNPKTGSEPAKRVEPIENAEIKLGDAIFLTIDGSCQVMAAVGLVFRVDVMTQTERFYDDSKTATSA